jgi:D-aminoacyl-tRNA deacylase
MTRVLLACTADPASLNIKDRLLENDGWMDVSTFDGFPVLRKGDTLLCTKKGLHLDLDLVDVEIARHIEDELPGMVSRGRTPLDLLVFLSKHRSEMKVDSLTVHSPGNFGDAQYGGRPGTLPPSSPRYVSMALRALYKAKKESGLKDRASYETTHHGPFLTSPSFFIEIGSDEARWVDRKLAEIIARSLLSWDMASPDGELPVCIGFGGGHYAPRFTDMAIQGKADFGHMVPDYAVPSPENVGGRIAMAARATPGVGSIHFHRTEKNAQLLPAIEHAADELGLRTI